MFLDACIAGTEMPISFAELVNTTEVTFAVESSLTERRSVALSEFRDASDAG